MANIPWGFGFERIEPNPLDSSSVFDTLAEFETYLASGLAYPGQVVAVRDGADVPKVFVVDNDAHSHTEVGLGGGAGGEVISHTRNELFALMQADELVPGALYEVSDYVTKYQMPFLHIIKIVDQPEPLVVRAETESSFSPIAHSKAHPHDVIYYDILDDRCEDNSTSRPGFIQRRIDTKFDVDCPHDWRAMVWPRFKVDSGSMQTFVPDTHVSKNEVYLDNGRIYIAIDTGIPTAVTDRNFLIELCGEDDYIFPSLLNPRSGGINVPISTTDYAERYLFNADIDLSKKEPTAPPTAWSPSLVRIASGNATSKWQEPYKHRFLNSVFMYDSFGNRPRLITADHGFRNNSFFQKHPGGAMSSGYHAVTRFGVSCHNNMFFGACYCNDFGSNLSTNLFLDIMYYNSIGPHCSTNITLYAFSFNTFGVNFSANIFLNASNHNTGGSSFCSNVFKGDCDHNNFGTQYQENRIGPGGMRKCTFGASCADNHFAGPVDSIIMGGKCVSNRWAAGCLNEQIGNSFISNMFRSQMRGNTFGNDINTIEIGSSDTDLCQNNTIGNNLTAFVAGRAFCNNTIGNGCMHITFGDDCQGNEIGAHCVIISFGNNATGNKIGDHCVHTSFAIGAFGNTVGQTCASISIGDHAIANTIGSKSTHIYFGERAMANVIEGICMGIQGNNGAHGNTFGTRCTSLNLGDHCQFNMFGNGCDDIEFGERSNDNVMKSHVTNLRMGSRCRNNQISSNRVELSDNSRDNLINRQFHEVTLNSMSGVMIGYGSNPNLLTNWDFRIPVNQRMSGSYTAANVWTIDCWQWRDGSMSGSTMGFIANNSIRLTSGTPMSAGAYSSFVTFIEYPEQYYGRPLTFSVLWSEDADDARIFITARTLTMHSSGGWPIPMMETWLNSPNWFLISGVDHLSRRFVGIQIQERTNTIRLYAAKLEAGPYSTLYSDRANYAEELQKCQRYQRVYGVDNIDTLRTTAPPMRIPTPAISPHPVAMSMFLYDANI